MKIVLRIINGLLLAVIACIAITFALISTNMVSVPLDGQAPILDSQQYQQKSVATVTPTQLIEEETPDPTYTSFTPDPEPTTITQAQPKTTATVPPTSQEDKAIHATYELPQPSDGVVGNTGLLPGTDIAVVSSRTEREIHYDSCTVAFSLPGKQGMPWAFTAGHCGKVGQKVYSIPKDGDFRKSVFLGTIRRVSMSDYDKGTGDWAAIRLSPKAELPKKETKITLKLDTRERKSGIKLCKSGATTGFNCGEKNLSGVRAQLGDYKNPDKFFTGKMDEVKLCALPGDSGSPVFDRQGIVGILSSTSASQEDVNKGQCSASNMAYYVPIRDVIEQIHKEVPDAVLP